MYVATYCATHILYTYAMYMCSGCLMLYPQHLLSYSTLRIPGLVFPRSVRHFTHIKLRVEQFQAFVSACGCIILLIIRI